MRSSSEESECAICLENKTGKVALLSCGHTYHYKCIEEWVNQKQNVLRCCWCFFIIVVVYIFFESLS